MAAVGELRRDKGTGTAPRWLAASNRWQARYTAADGRQRSVYSPIPGSAGAKACAKLRDEAIAAAAAGVDPSLTPLADYLERWLARRRDLLPASRERYARLVRLHVRGSTARDARGRAIATKPLIRLTTDDVEDLYLAAEAKGMAPKGIELLHTMLHAALEQAAGRGKVLRNAAAGAVRAKVRRAVPEVYDDGQLRQLLDAAEGTPIAGLVALLATTSLRHGELLELRWSDLELDRARVVIATPEKEGRPRTIPLTPRAARLLRAHRARQNEARLARAGAWEESDRVFPDRLGARGSMAWNREQLHALTARHGLPPATPRNLRHAVITSLLRNGVHMKVAQELAGHASMKQTSDTYSHVDEGMLAVAVDVLSRVVGE